MAVLLATVLLRTIEGPQGWQER